MAASTAEGKRDDRAAPSTARPRPPGHARPGGMETMLVPRTPSPTKMWPESRPGEEADQCSGQDGRAGPDDEPRPGPPVGDEDDRTSGPVTLAEQAGEGEAQRDVEGVRGAEREPEVRREREWSVAGRSHPPPNLPSGRRAHYRPNAS
jgi:hypothetical protein